MKTALSIQSPKAFPSNLLKITPTCPTSTLAKDCSQKFDFDASTKIGESILENEEGLINFPSEMTPKPKKFSCSFIASSKRNHSQIGKPPKIPVYAGIGPKIVVSKANSNTAQNAQFSFQISPIKSRNCPNNLGASKTLKIPDKFDISNRKNSVQAKNKPFSDGSEIFTPTVTSKSFMFPNTPQRNLSPIKSKLQNRLVRMQAEAHNRLREFLLKKRELEQKYTKIFEKLEIEQAQEINMRIEKTKSDEIEKLKIIIKSIKDEYNLTKDLFEEQRIMEETELLKDYESKIEKNAL